MTAEKLLVTAKEAAEILSIGVSEVYNLAARGDLEKRFIGSGRREFRIPMSSLRAFAEGLPTEQAAS